MTIAELENYLSEYPPDAVVAFQPREMTGIGIPRWLDARVRREYDGDDVPTGVVVVELEEMGDC